MIYAYVPILRRFKTRKDKKRIVSMKSPFPIIVSFILPEILYTTDHVEHGWQKRWNLNIIFTDPSSTLLLIKQDDTNIDKKDRKRRRLALPAGIKVTLLEEI